MPRRKVFAYIVRMDLPTPKLLASVSWVTDGFEVPRGGVEPNETLSQAVLREVDEESGLRALRIVKEIGMAHWQDEEQHFFVLECLQPPIANFFHTATGLGIDVGSEFQYCWLDLTPALHTVLVEGCSAFVSALLAEYELPQ